MKKYLIKLLGVFTKEEFISSNIKNQIHDNNILDSLNIKILHDGKSLAVERAFGVKFVNNEDLPAVIINLAQSNGLNLYNSNGFSKACSKILEEHERILKDVRNIDSEVCTPDKNIVGC